MTPQGYAPSHLESGTAPLGARRTCQAPDRTAEVDALDRDGLEPSIANSTSRRRWKPGTHRARSETGGALTSDGVERSIDEIRDAGAHAACRCAAAGDGREHEAEVPT